MATEKILGTACINKITEKISHKNGTLHLIGSDLVVIEEGVGYAAYMADKDESKQGHYGGEFSRSRDTMEVRLASIRAQQFVNRLNDT